MNKGILSKGVTLFVEGCLNLIFPPCCHVCGTSIVTGSKDLICKNCICGIRRIEEPVCSICGMEIYAQGTLDHICGDCLKVQPPFDYARSLFLYDEEMRILISALKYKKETSALRAIRQLINMCDLSAFDGCDFMIPVPLHKKRIQQRTFNQALLLAKACFGTTDKRVLPSALKRTVHTVPQVLLDAKKRRSSLKNVFTVNSKVKISGMSICLIDDVYTTGTTVSECSRALMAAGAAKVFVLTLARVKVPRRSRR